MTRNLILFILWPSKILIPSLLLIVVIDIMQKKNKIHFIRKGVSDLPATSLLPLSSNPFHSWLYDMGWMWNCFSFRRLDDWHIQSSWGLHISNLGGRLFNSLLLSFCFSLGFYIKADSGLKQTYFQMSFHVHPMDFFPESSAGTLGSFSASSTAPSWYLPTRGKIDLLKHTQNSY